MKTAKAAGAAGSRAQGAATVAQLAEFDELIDARSPAEYADDHLPGAISCPVLDDQQRARVGTLYQASPFEARKLGAIWVARNVAAHIERLFMEQPRDWRPLVYCWRGGQRSGAFSHILRQIGWDAQRLEGGYKSWRRHVLDELAVLPQRFRYRVVTGATGSGKSRLLEALAAQGAQVLHLEQLASHKGSVLGPMPQTRQPSQRSFESRIHQRLASFDEDRQVFVEAESRRIGSVQLPDALLAAIRTAPGLRIEATPAARVAFLLQDYDYFLADPDWLIERLEQLTGLQSRETVTRWIALARQGEFPALVEELLESHYDPLYLRSQAKNFSDFDGAIRIGTDDLSPSAMERLAGEILRAS